ncbi:M-phase-specific PLK1-interacting protein [Menidia menidia]
MDGAPGRPQRSPGVWRPPGRFHSASPGWRFPGTRAPYPGCSPPGTRAPYPGCSPPGPRAPYPGCSPPGPPGSPGLCRGGSRPPPAFSPGSAPHRQSRPSGPAVEAFFSPSMLTDPWQGLPPLTAAAAAARRRGGAVTPPHRLPPPTDCPPQAPPPRAAPWGGR